MFLHLLTYILSFCAIWIGSGLAVKSVERVSQSLRLSSFVVSFVVLGLFTSVSEFSVGLNSVMQHDPEIFVGNLIGASIVLFMLLIPLLAVIGKPIRVTPEFQGFNLPASLMVVALPVLLALDGRVGKTDSVLSMVLYALLLLNIQNKRGLIERLQGMSKRSGNALSRELFKIVFGVATIFIASRFVVQHTLYFAQYFHVTPFLISLLVIAIGTNIPELSLVLRSIFMRNNQVAFGDYVGSAAFNTFLLGFLTQLNGEPVLLTNSYIVSLLFLIIGLVLFYVFARSKNTISRAEGLVLLSLYGLFLFTEIVIHGGVSL